MAASRRARLVLLLISSALALLVAEVALRIAGVSNPNFYQPDPVRGWALRPGAEGWWRKEGNAWVKINRDGMRDEEHPAAKPAGELRIAVLGDSCVEALQVPAEKTFWALLEKELARCPAVRGRKVEALSFGVSGYGTAQELLTLRHQVWKYDPDLVLLAFYTGNDVRNNYRPLELDPARPYFTLAAEGKLALDDSFRETSGYRMRQTAPARLLYALFDRSRLLQLGKQAKSAVDGWIGAWKASRVEAGAAVHELGLDNAVYSPPSNADWQKAWSITEAMLRAARDESADHRTPFAVVTLTTGMQVHPDPGARRAFMERLGIGTLFYPDARIAELGRREGIPVLNLARSLQRQAEREKAFLHGFPNTGPGEGHWNERGHAAAAREMAGWVCGRLQ
ncbi:MAG TPA: SGNH/GDSL hydrolase family protein [Thermoanaerobaculia bacterium]